MADNFKISTIRRRQLPLENYFDQTADRKMAYCPDTRNLMEYFGHADYNPNDWTLFIDSATNKSGSSKLIFFLGSPI